MHGFKIYFRYKSMIIVINTIIIVILWPLLVGYSCAEQCANSLLHI